MGELYVNPKLSGKCKVTWHDPEDLKSTIIKDDMIILTYYDDCVYEIQPGEAEPS